MNPLSEPSLTASDAAAHYLDYWGKAHPDAKGPRFHRLAYHCLDVAAVGARLIREDRALCTRLANASGLQSDSVQSLIPFALALHDLGKFSFSFQDLRSDLAQELQAPRKPRGYPTRHDAMGLSLWCEHFAGSECIQRWLHATGDAGRLGCGDLEYLVKPWMRAVTGHHGQPAIDHGGLANHFHPSERSRTDATAFAEQVSKLLGPVELRFTRPLLDENVESALKPSSWLVAGIAVLADWIGSNEDWFAYREERIPLDAYWRDSEARAARALKLCGILPIQTRAQARTRELFPAVQAPRPMQREVDAVELAAGPQLFILEDLTGSGKTEAAVVLAQRLMAAGAGGGIFFALPTMATANAMYERIREVVPKLFAQGEQPSVVLAHSAPQLQALRNIELPRHCCPDDYQSDDPSISAQCSSWIADSRKRALLAHVGVGTIDQALMAVMQVRHGTLRLVGLNRNVLIVDEVHAYDAYMTEHLARLLEFHAGLGGSAILLSATIPTEHRRKLVAAFRKGLGAPREFKPAADYPLLTQVATSADRQAAVGAASESRRKVKVKLLDSFDAAAELVAGAARAGKCVCWIRNTVADAIEAHARLCELLPAPELQLFHARFAMGTGSESRRASWLHSASAPTRCPDREKRWSRRRWSNNRSTSISTSSSPTWHRST